MIKGQLASLQRDHAWDGFSQAERAAGQARGAYNPYQSNDPAQANSTPDTAEKRQIREDLDYARLDGGQADRGRIALSGGAARQAAEAAEDKKKRDKEAVDRAELLMLQAQQAAAYYGEIADGLEETFENKYGAQWREHMALQILDEDEMPLRRDGESMADYEARVEQALMDKLLDENGNIKPEYKDHPEYGQWAEWARARHHERVAEDYISKRSTLPEAEQAQLDEQFVQSSTYEEIAQASQEAELAGEKIEALQEKTDAVFKSAANASSEMGFSDGP